MAVLFHGRILSGYEKTEDAEKYGRSHQKAGYPVEEPEESPETHDGYRSPHGGYAPCVHITEHDEGGNAQCDGPYPSVRLNLSDIFPCFHDILVLTGETVVSNFKGRDADRLHRQGFRGKIPERREDDFPRNPEGLTLHGWYGHGLPLPVVMETLPQYDGILFSD